MLSQRDEMRRMRAIRQSPTNIRMQELFDRAEETRTAYEKSRLKEAAAFRAWEETDRFLQFLEELRDEHTPKAPDEPWDNLFCMAVELIPGYRSKARELWLEYAATTNP